ncbi:MAG: 50S ribosomal protein L31 [Vampirovibrio sp.]|jgi:large subunit ribosomal protein L31
MKAGIHPDYQQVEVVCVCGNSFYVGSTQKVIRVEICSACHPVYSGDGSRIVDTEGRVERFKRRYTKANG